MRDPARHVTSHFFHALEGLSMKSWRGCFVRWLISFPAMAYVLCSLVCQQRCFWLAIAKVFVAFLGFLGAVFNGCQCFKNATVPTMVTIEDFFLHSFNSVASTFENCFERYSLHAYLSQALEGGQIPCTSFLVIHGAEDEIVPVEKSRNFCRCYPQMTEFEELPCCDHASIGQAHLDDVLRIIIPWLHGKTEPTICGLTILEDFAKQSSKVGSLNSQEEKSIHDVFTENELLENDDSLLLGPLR